MAEPRTFGGEAAELYRMVAGQELAGGERSVLDEMLAVDSDGRWCSPRYRAAYDGPPLPAPPVLCARALAGLFLLGEDVIWSSRRHPSMVDAFRRLRELIDGADALRLQVRRIYAANGAQRIDLHDGRWLRFVTRARGGGGRGLTTDCYLMDEHRYSESLDEVWPSLVARPNPQLVTHDE